MPAKEHKGSIKKIKALIKQKESEMNMAVKALDFETAALLRDEIVALAKVSESIGGVVEAKKTTGYDDMSKVGDKKKKEKHPDPESKHITNVKFGKRGSVKKVKDVAKSDEELKGMKNFR